MKLYYTYIYSFLNSYTYEEKNIHKGLKYLKESAKFGNEEAMLILSSEYFKGKNLKKNDLKGYAWLKEAQGRDNRVAHDKMIEIFENGLESIDLKPDKGIAKLLREKFN